MHTLLEECASILMENINESPEGNSINESSCCMNEEIDWAGIKNSVTAFVNGVDAITNKDRAVKVINGAIDATKRSCDAIKTGADKFGNDVIQKLRNAGVPEAANRYGAQIKSIIKKAFPSVSAKNTDSVKPTDKVEDTKNDTTVAE